VEVETESLQAKNESNEKENFIVIAAVIATGDELPLEFIACGKITRVEMTQIGQVDGHWWSHSQNEWPISETFQNSIVNLRFK
jgi:hypothetical protein